MFLVLPFFAVKCRPGKGICHARGCSMRSWLGLLGRKKAFFEGGGPRSVAFLFWGQDGSRKEQVRKSWTFWSLNARHVDEKSLLVESSGKRNLAGCSTIDEGWMRDRSFLFCDLCWLPARARFAEITWSWSWKFQCRQSQSLSVFFASWACAKKQQSS